MSDTAAEDDEFADLFDSSILHSLEGALNDISLQMQSADEDDEQTNNKIGEDNDDDNDYDMETDDDDDDYTYNTYDTDFTSDEDEDPETGEEELYAMMDNLVAELEMEMDNLDSTEEKAGDQALVIEEEKGNSNQEDNKEPSPESSSPDKIDQVPMSIETNSTMISTLSSSDGDEAQNRRNMERAKSLWKVLSGLAQPDEQGGKKFDPDMTPKAANQSFFDKGYGSPEEEEVNSKRETKNFKGMLSPAAGDPDYVPVSDYTNLPRSDSGSVGGRSKSSYVPSKEDFQQLVGILADFSRRKRRVQLRDDRLADIANQEIPDLAATPSDTTFDKVPIPTKQDPDYVPVSDYSPMRRKPKKTAETDDSVLVEELQLPDTEAFARTEGERKKTGRAIANFALKKRREYLQRKSQLQQEQGEEPNARNDTSVGTSPTKARGNAASTRTPERKAVQHRRTKTSKSPTRTSPPTGAVPTPNSNNKKRRKRTNKHRKGKPKKASPTKAPQPAGHSPLPSARLPRVRVRSTENPASRDEVVRALAETEIWHWLINQVRVAPT